jgi:hypothetical protein
MKRIGLWAIKTVVFLLTAGVVAAQTESRPPAVIHTVPPGNAELPEMVTDRPDFTESTDVVGKGVVQIENGLTVERSRGVNSFAGPELLIRVGLTKRLELRVGGDGFLSVKLPGADRVAGHSDVETAVKILLVDQGRHRPALSLIPILSLPLGSPDFSSGGYDPTLKVALGKDLPAGFSLGGNVNLSSINTPDGRFLQTAYSASVGHSLGRGFGGYWELFGFTPWEKDGSAAWIANAGITHSIGRNAQVDLRVGKRLTDAGPGWFWGIGLAVREHAWRSRRGGLSAATGRPPKGAGATQAPR